MTALDLTLRDYGGHLSPATRHSLSRGFYVDDLLISTTDVKQAGILQQEARQLLAKGGFNLTKWGSSHEDVLLDVPVEERGPAFKEIGQPTLDRALGVHWNPEADYFTFVTQPRVSPFTKRGILSQLSSLYDPMGIASPFILRARLIFQQLCRQHSDWDDDLPSHLQPAWETWLQELPQLVNIQLPRCVNSARGEDHVFRLHHCCDASEAAYGVVSYLVTYGPANEIISSTFLLGKARLAPLKKPTIPRLELMAATLGATQDEFLRRELTLPLQESMFWTDSTITLAYITNETKRLQTFVANRVTKIRSQSEPHQWHHISTKVNPADHASRGLSAMDLVTTNWLTGPSWGDLTPTPATPSLKDDDPDVKAVTLVTQTTSDNTLDLLIGRYSVWH